MTPWWKGAVIYQIYPRSFGDADGDGVGDLKGVLERLDYVASLGVDGIWLSPFFKSPMKDFGYDVADYCNVDPLFGTLADFDALVEKAHALGLKIIIDQVYSHTSDAHPWFAESRAAKGGSKSDFYVWADAKSDGTAPNNWMSVFGGPSWEWAPERRQYYLHNFLAAQPDLNFHNAAVRAEILKVAEFWLARGVDGFRLDVINYCIIRRRHTKARRPPRRFFISAMSTIARGPKISISSRRCALLSIRRATRCCSARYSTMRRCKGRSNIRAKGDCTPLTAFIS